jgi:iron-sulfur cluster assembly protein
VQRHEALAESTPMTTTLTLTEKAARQIQAQLAKRGKGMGLRVGVKKVGCSGFAYTFDYADDVARDDHVVEAHGAKVVVAADSVGFLSGAKLDFVREGFKQVFKFDNPNVEGTCGCGESFNVKSRDEATTGAAAGGPR